MQWRSHDLTGRSAVCDILGSLEIPPEEGTSEMNEESARTQTGADVAEALALDPERRNALASWARGSLGLHQADVDDVLQDTYIELLRYPSAIFQPEGFAFHVFKARCWKLLRHRRSRPDSRSTDGGLRELQAPELPADDRVLVEQGLARLTSRCRHLILAYYFEGKMPRETVHEVGLASPKVVSELTSRCLRRLRQWLQGR